MLLHHILTLGMFTSRFLVGLSYIRQGANSQQLTRDEIRDFFIEEGLVRFDEQPSENFRFDKNKFFYIQKRNS